MKIILDTNMLMVPGSLGVDILTQIKEQFPRARIITIQAVVDELEILSQGNTKEAQAAKLGLKITKQLEVSEETGYADDILEELADKDTIIATQDQELKRRLKKKEVPYVVLKNKQVISLA